MGNTGSGRYWVALGMFLLALLLYIDRVCISVAQGDIAAELGFSDKAMGWVLSVFALGYALFQVPSGLLADRHGPRRILSGIVVFWSLLTALTGAAWNFVSMLFIRFFFGAGEAGAFPGMSRAVFSWMPMQERGLILGLNFSGSRLGAAFGLPLVAWLVDAFGWRQAFVWLGLAGIAWALVWWWQFRDRPEDHPRISEKELQYIRESRQAGNEKGGQPLEAGQLLRSRNMWLAIGQYFCSNFTFFFALTWLFPHIKKEYQLENLAAGWYAVSPLLAGALGNWVGGLWVDRLLRKGQWNASRVRPAATGFVLAAGGLLASMFMGTPLGAVFFLSIAIFGADMTLPPSWALCVDIGKEHSGAVSGTMNMAGNLGAFLTALAFPYLTAWTGTVDAFFYLAAALNSIAVLLWINIRADKGLDYQTG